MFTPGNIGRIGCGLYCAYYGVHFGAILGDLRGTWTMAKNRARNNRRGIDDEFALKLGLVGKIALGAILGGTAGWWVGSRGGAWAGRKVEQVALREIAYWRKK